MRVAGIMSGTSLDGIDVAIVDIGGRARIRTVAFETAPYPARVREALLGVSNAATHTATIARLHFLLGELYARAVESLCRGWRVPLESIELIGCHGQTIFHDSTPAPFLRYEVPSTLQIGEAAVIAERTGIPVISDFRPRDVAAGGKGAPLVPYVDYLLFRNAKLNRVALNIGGIANITAIRAGARPEDVIAFDTGPGNMAVDALVARYTRGRQSFDRGGRIAHGANVRRELLAELLRDRYYRLKPPKTAGREQYGPEFVERLLASGAPPADLIATATALTASAVALGIERFVRPKMAVDELIVSGGGAHNAEMMAELAALLPGVAVCRSSDYGIDVDAKEAVAFALLAFETWRRRPSNLPSATGARRAVVLGKVTPGNNRRGRA
ncbi:MAG: anhydro-N-acetylmuramic acid kinase [Acidobacteriota bacterium]